MKMFPLRQHIECIFSWIYLALLWVYEILLNIIFSALLVYWTRKTRSTAAFIPWPCSLWSVKSGKFEFVTRIINMQFNCYSLQTFWINKNTKEIILILQQQKTLMQQTFPSVHKINTYLVLKLKFYFIFH